MHNVGVRLGSALAWKFSPRSRDVFVGELVAILDDNDVPVILHEIISSALIRNNVVGGNAHVSFLGGTLVLSPAMTLRCTVGDRGDQR